MDTEVKLVANDLFGELLDENLRLIDEFTANKRCFQLLQDYRKLLTDIFQTSIDEKLLVHRQAFDGLEDQCKDIERQIETIGAKKYRRSDELRTQIDEIGHSKRESLNRSEDKEEVSDEDPNDTSTNECDNNFKFLSPDDRLVEEDGAVVTERHPKNPKILVVRLNGSPDQTLGYRCNWSDCQYVSVAKLKLETHLQSVHDKRGMFVCHKCKDKFVSQKQLNSHTISEHSKQYKCDFDDCGFECRTRQHLNDHLRRHKGQKPYVCSTPDCGKGFATRQELRRHNNNVHNRESFICDWPGCELGFKSNKALQTHQTSHMRTE